MDDENWLKDTTKLADLAKKAEKDLQSLKGHDEKRMSDYYDLPVPNVDYERPYREHGIYEELKDSFGGNLTREVVDASISQVCRELDAEIIPVGGDHNLDVACKQANRLIEGVAEDAEIFSVLREICRDGLTASVGAAKLYIDKANKAYAAARINPQDLFWVEDGTRNPRVVMEVTAVSRDYLMDAHPKHKQQIKDLPDWAPRQIVGVDHPSYGRARGTVKVVEAWSRKVGSSAGKHAIVAGDSGDLVFESSPWNHFDLPLMFFRWQSDNRGFPGVSLARIVSRYDNANRRLLRMVYAILAGQQPKIMAHEDSEFEGMSDQEYEVLRWSGPIQPQFTSPAPVPAGILDEIERNRNRAYAEGGVNQGLASGNVPTRFSSGRAQQEYVDIANTRLIEAHEEWKKPWRQFARAVVMLHQHAGEINVRMRGARRYTAVTFPASLPDGGYRITYGLSSGLSLTTARKIEDLEKLAELGLADAADVARSLDLPDIKRMSDRLNAPRDLVHKQVSKALDEGIYIMPSTMQGEALHDLIRIAGQEYQRAKLEEIYPPGNVELLRRLRDAAMVRVAPPPAPPAPPPEGGQPPAEGQMPPVEPQAQPPLA